MPIKIKDSLPAQKTLESENIFVMTEYRAMHQDIRPLHVLVLNLMPTKIETETQLLRKLSNTTAGGCRIPADGKLPAKTCGTKSSGYVLSGI